MPDTHDTPFSRDTRQGAQRPRDVPPFVSDEDEFADPVARAPSELEAGLPAAKERTDRRTLGVDLPPLPQRKPPSRRKLGLSFLLCVVLPTGLIALYYYMFAADQYVAEFKFAVMESSPVIPGSPPPISATSPSAAMGGAGGLALMGGGGAMLGGSTATMQNYVVTDYLLSRQVVEELQRRIDIRSLYDRDVAKSDLWARFASSLPMERFLVYWNRMVTANYDPMTGLAVVTVRAFSPQDALLIANTMVTLSEDLVNSVAKRPQTDPVRLAKGEVRRTEERLKAARDELMDYRLKEGLVDPSGALSTNVALVQTLRGQLMQQQADLATLLSQQQNPNTPAAQSLRSRIAATKDQLDKMVKEVSKDREGNRVLTELVGRYERLDLERQYAQAAYVAAQQAFDQARANAAAQHLYLTPYVRPVLAESSTYPKRGQSTFIAALAFFGIWILGLMVVRAVGEHV